MLINSNTQNTPEIYTFKNTLLILIILPIRIEIGATVINCPHKRLFTSAGVSFLNLQWLLFRLASVYLIIYLP